MIAWLLTMICFWYDDIERRRLEAYVANAKDLGDVERRIRALEHRDAL